MKNEIVKIENLWVSINGVSVLENINLTVKEKDFLGIIGPNGGGKTTLLKAILGLIDYDRGRITIYGENVLKKRKLLGYVPQYAEFDRDFPVSVWETVLMGRLGHKKGITFSKLDKQIAEQSLQKTEMYHLRSRPMGKLSGGERQRVLVARALAANPQILVLDEPTASVDSKFEIGFFELLKELNKDITIIMVSHDLSAVAKYVSTIACLNRTLYYHNSKEITNEMIQKTYNCPVDLIAHGVPHRVLNFHNGVVGE